MRAMAKSRIFVNVDGMLRIGCCGGGVVWKRGHCGGEEWGWKGYPWRRTCRTKVQVDGPKVVGVLIMWINEMWGGENVQEERGEAAQAAQAAQAEKWTATSSTTPHPTTPHRSGPRRQRRCLRLWMRELRRR